MCGLYGTQLLVLIPKFVYLFADSGDEYEGRPAGEWHSVSIFSVGIQWVGLLTLRGLCCVGWQRVCTAPATTCAFNIDFCCAKFYPAIFSSACQALVHSDISVFTEWLILLFAECRSKETVTWYTKGDNGTEWETGEDPLLLFISLRQYKFIVWYIIYFVGVFNDNGLWEFTIYYISGLVSVVSTN
jgi:hypothetical protein